MKKFLLAALFGLTLTGMASANVTVSGNGKVTYVPDLGYIHAGVTSEAKTAQEAWEKNAAIVKKMFEALEARGLKPRDMQTTNLNISPKYFTPHDEKGNALEPVLVGYVASYDLSITIRKLDDLGPVLDDLVKAGANRSMSISFGSSDLDRLMDEARARAASEARKNANIYVSAAGGKLGRLLAVSDVSHFEPQLYRLELDRVTAKAAAEHLRVAAGEQKLSVNVTLTFAISQD
jgi:uncharacterized protein YggE